MCDKVYIFLHLTSTDNYSVIFLVTMFLHTIFGYLRQNTFKNGFISTSSSLGVVHKCVLKSNICQKKLSFFLYRHIDTGQSDRLFSQGRHRTVWQTVYSGWTLDSLTNCLLKYFPIGTNVSEWHPMWPNATSPLQELEREPNV